MHTYKSQRGKLLLSVIAIMLTLCSCTSAVYSVNQGDHIADSQSLEGKSPTSTPTLVSCDLALASAGNNAGYYTIDEFGSNEIATYIDYANLVQTPLCARPNCHHSDSSCTAYSLVADMSIPVFAVVNDKLFTVQTESNADSPAQIVMSELDGSNAIQLYELDSNICIVPPLYTDETYLYALLTEADETTTHLSLVRFNIDDPSSSYEELFKFNDGTSGQIVSCFGDKLELSLFIDDKESNTLYRCAQIFDVKENRIEDPLALYSMEEDEGYLFNKSEFASINTFDANACIITFTDLLTQSTNTFTPKELLAKTGMTSARINVYALWDGWYRISFNQDGEIVSYNVNPTTGESVFMTLYYEQSTNAILVLSEINDMLLVRASWDVQRSGDSITNLRPVYALMSKDDYLHSRPVYQYITRLEE